ncbi:hypothetical protein CBR_g36232 [Chara braunii]|uniref:Uncharacterized protein n=1 Tax=Chara braunii TaxID=69332 RepID=A0A388LKF1_CHABU|nr:hypothetical protein CBR_g36232 [Chara braunii]|eukprot:GBG82702.1 hypothetical protein CBR_g36232 [Chara braunii]
MDSGGPTVGVRSDSVVEGERGPESGGGTGGGPHGDDGNHDVGVHSSDDDDGGEARHQDIIDRVIVGLCAADMKGGMSGARGTSQMGDAVMEEAGLCTDCQGSDASAGRSPVMEGGPHIDQEARSSPSEDAAGDMSLALIVRSPSAFYADEGRIGGRLDERLGECNPPTLDPEQLECTGMEDPYAYTSRRRNPRQPLDGFRRLLGGFLRTLDGQNRLAVVSEGKRPRTGRRQLVLGGGSAGDMHPPRPPPLFASPQYGRTNGRAGTAVASSSRGASRGGWSSRRRVT